MSWPVEKILEEAFKLDPKDRALLVADALRYYRRQAPAFAEVLALEYRQIVRHAQEFPGAGAVEALRNRCRCAVFCFTSSPTKF